MPRLPAPINWLRQRNQPDDLLMTYSETRLNENQKYLGENEYSQIMSPDEVKDFLSNLVNVWLDSLELTTISVEVRDSDSMQVYDESGLEIYEEQEWLVPQWNNSKVVIFFFGLDLLSSDDDNSFRLGRFMPDADLEAVRNLYLETIDEYLTPPIRLSKITLFTDNSTTKFLFRPLNPINLDEMFGLE